MNQKWIDALNIRVKTMKLLEENPGVKLHGLEWWILRHDTKGTNDERKNRYMGLHQNQKRLCIKGHYQECEKTTYRMGENICRLCI